MKVPVVLYHEPSGGYSVVCPTLPGCHSQGETVEEALANVREAAALYLETLEEDGLPVLETDDWLIAAVEVTCHSPAS